MEPESDFHIMSRRIGPLFCMQLFFLMQMMIVEMRKKERRVINNPHPDHDAADGDRMTIRSYNGSGGSNPSREMSIEDGKKETGDNRS